MEAGLPTPSQQYSASADARLQQYGASYAWYQRMYRLYINEINSYSSPGARIGISHVEAQLANQALTGHNTDWVENRLAWRLDALRSYHDEGDAQPGHELYVFSFTDVAPPEWWYYH